MPGTTVRQKVVVNGSFHSAVLLRQREETHNRAVSQCRYNLRIVVKPIELNTAPLITGTKVNSCSFCCLITHVTSLSRTCTTFWWRLGIRQPHSFQRVSQVSPPGASDTQPLCLHWLSEASARSRYTALFSSSWVHPLFCLKSSPQRSPVPGPQPACSAGSAPAYLSWDVQSGDVVLERG